ncbi:MAG: hypothetical protein EOM24_14825, partial [Chloroflexia bacterium]|nr:hypothetical protein [Chloroflexia bacterium]
MVRTAPHDSGATTGRRRTDAEFEAVLEQELRNSPAKQRAMRRLRRLMDADGQVVLRGGVRGWMLILDCGASRPRWLLEELATYGLITLRITPTGERTLCAEVAVCAAFEATADAAPGASGGANARRRMDTTLADASTDPTNHSTPVVNRSPLEAPILNQPNQGSDAGGSGPAPDRLMSAATRPLTEAPVAPPSKPTLNSAESDGQAPWTPPVAPDAGRVGGDPSRIDPPPHPPMWNHDSMQQQHGHTQSEEPTGISFVQRLLQAFPETDRALLTAWASNPLVNECAAALAALQGFPTATLEAWQQDLAAARSRPNIVLPEGLVLACWSRGERVNAARVRPSATPQATPRQERRRSQPAAPRAYDAARVRAQLTLAAALDGAPNPTEGSGLEP